MSKVIPLLFLIIGVFVLGQISLPVIAFGLWERQSLDSDSILVSPQVRSESVLGVSIENSDNFPAFISTTKRLTAALYSDFNLNVPALNIKDAKVLVDSNDLIIGLAHLPGVALPGERGNVFISGHSALPLFFQGDKNYATIFANLEKLKKGDKIIATVGKTEFTYQVLGFKVVGPKDLSVIAPPDLDGRYISLMTCVPPGLNTKRLVVIGKII